MSHCISEVSQSLCTVTQEDLCCLLEARHPLVIPEVCQVSLRATHMMKGLYHGYTMGCVSTAGTYIEQKSVLEVGVVSVTFFTAVQAVVLVSDLLVAVCRRTTRVQTVLLTNVNHCGHAAEVSRLKRDIKRKQQTKRAFLQSQNLCLCKRNVFMILFCKDF